METIIGESAAANGELIKDSDTQGFVADVIEASHKVPVLVDFWAPWCGPCKQLTPLLEKVVKAARGAVRLVKVNIDESPEIAEQLRVQSIPAVFAFTAGQPVDGFVGVQPESTIRALVERLGGGAVGASPVDEALAAAQAALENGDAMGAAQLYGQALEHEAGNPKATAGLARCFIAAGELERARATLDGVPAEHHDHTDVAAARSALELAQAAGSAPSDTGLLREELARDPDDHQARFDLALALYKAGDGEAAVEEFMEVVRRDRRWNDEAARKELVKIFDTLGGSHPLTVSARRQLSSILFS